MERKSPGFILAWSTICLFLVSFSFAAYGIFVPAFLQEFNWSSADSALPFSLAMFVWGAMQPLSGALADARGTRPVILMGIALMALGFVVVGLSQELWQMALGFGLLIGTAQSSCGTMQFSLLISKWFAGNKRGSAVGLLQSAPPGSPMLLTPLMFYVIVNYGWRYGAIGMGLILLVVAFPLAYFKVHDPRAEVGIQAAAQGQHGNWRVAIGMLRLPALRNLFVSRFACGLSFLLIPHLATAAMASGLSAAQGALAVTLYGASGAIGSYTGGVLSDRFGRVPTLVGTYVVRGIGVLVLALFTMNNPVLFFLAVMMASGPVFATVSINNVQTFELLRGRNVGLVLGLGFVLHQIAAAVGPYLSGMVFDWTGTYRISFLVLGVVMLLATIPAAYTGERKPTAPARVDGRTVEVS